MKSLVILSLLTLNVGAAEIEDKGVLSKLHSLIFDTTAEFASLHITLHPQWQPTNEINISTTNKMLQFSEIPTNIVGPVIGGVVTINDDGEASEPTLFKFIVRRSSPKKPRIVNAKLSNNIANTNLNITQAIHSAMHQETSFNGLIAPPLPGGSYLGYGEQLITNITTITNIIRYSTNKGIIDMQNFYNDGIGKRRSSVK